jgi:hypothetical protein
VGWVTLGEGLARTAFGTWTLGIWIDAPLTGWVRDLPILAWAGARTVMPPLLIRAVAGGDWPAGLETAARSSGWVVTRLCACTGPVRDCTGFEPAR